MEHTSYISSNAITDKITGLMILEDYMMDVNTYMQRHHLRNRSTIINSEVMIN